MKHITVISEDRPGVLAEVTELLNSQGVDIRGLDSQLAGSQLFLKLHLSDPDLGLSLLNSAGFQVVSEQSVLVCIEDKPGALARIARRLADHQIELRGISLVHQEQGFWSVAVSSDDDQRVREVLQDILVS